MLSADLVLMDSNIFRFQICGVSPMSLTRTALWSGPEALMREQNTTPTETEVCSLLCPVMNFVSIRFSSQGQVAALWWRIGG